MKEFISETIMEKYEFRNIRPEEVDQAVRMEQICFPPNEACSEKHMRERILQVSEFFLVAVDKETGKIAGFLSGNATDEEVFRDEFLYQYLKREKENGREKVFLTCLDNKVEMYTKMGYKDLGISDSSWGGEEWHDMLYTL